MPHACSFESDGIDGNFVSTNICIKLIHGYKHWFYLYGEWSVHALGACLAILQ